MTMTNPSRLALSQAPGLRPQASVPETFIECRKYEWVISGYIINMREANSLTEKHNHESK
jgi:hypothetical protein